MAESSSLVAPRGSTWRACGSSLAASSKTGSLSPEEALVRECEEECGIEVEVAGILEVTHHRYPEKEVLLLFYRCELRAGEVRHLQVADHAWVAPVDLGSYPLPPADQAVIARIRALEC